jgi:hypothetical protein
MKKMYSVVLLAAVLLAQDPHSPSVVDSETNWELVSQSFNAVTGELIGPPHRIACDPVNDYMNGVLDKPEDCKNGLFLTSAECSRAQMGRINPTRHKIGVIWFCRHRVEKVI